MYDDDDIKMYNLIYTYIVSKGTFNLFISYIQSINRENFIRKQHKVLIYNIQCVDYYVLIEAMNTNERPWPCVAFDNK